MQDEQVKSNPQVPWQNDIQQEDALQQQTGLKLGEELNEMLHLEHRLLQR